MVDISQWSEELYEARFFSPDGEDMGTVTSDALPEEIVKSVLAHVPDELIEYSTDDYISFKNGCAMTTGAVLLSDLDVIAKNAAWVSTR